MMGTYVENVNGYKGCFVDIVCLFFLSFFFLFWVGAWVEAFGFGFGCM